MSSPKLNALVHVYGEGFPRLSVQHEAEVVFRTNKDGSLEVIRSSLPEVPLGTYVQGDVVKLCDTHGELFHHIPGIMKGCYAGNEYLPCSGQWIERGQA